MIPLGIFLHVASLILLVLAALNVESNRVSLGWLGLACWVATTFVR